MSIVIALGHKARSGKDFAAAHIIETFHDQYDIRRYAFGDVLKVELYDALLNPLDPYWQIKPEYLTLPHPTGSVFDSDAIKVNWVDIHKVELRPYLQHYGTEYRRSKDPFYWVNKTRVKVAADNPQIAIISDLRFLTEYYWVKSVGGYTIKVTRHGFAPVGGEHVSEHELNNTVFDYEINCLDGELDQLRRDAVTVFEMIKADTEMVVPELPNVLVQDPDYQEA